MTYKVWYAIKQRNQTIQVELHTPVNFGVAEYNDCISIDELDSSQRVPWILNNLMV